MSDQKPAAAGALAGTGMFVVVYGCSTGVPEVCALLGFLGTVILIAGLLMLVS